MEWNINEFQIDALVSSPESLINWVTSPSLFIFNVLTESTCSILNEIRISSAKEIVMVSCLSVWL